MLETLTGLGLCDQLDENPDVKVKGEIWAEPEQRPRSPDFCSRVLFQDPGLPRLLGGEAVRLRSCPVCPAWSNRADSEMERWFEFCLNASKSRPERNVCWRGWGLRGRPSLKVDTHNSISRAWLRGCEVPVVAEWSSALALAPPTSFLPFHC